MAELSMVTVDTGTIGQLYLQDSGSYIVLGIRVKDANYTKNGLKFEWSSPLDRGTVSSWNLPAGGGLIAIRSFAAPLSGEVKWTLKATGTTELGGPTTLKHTISRSESVPDVADIQRVYMTSATAAYVYWSVRQTGGKNLRVTRFDLGYGTNPTKPVTILNSASPAQDYQGSKTVKGLAANTTYYFFVRVWNKQGHSGWSDPVGVVTSGGVMIKYENRWRNAEPYVKTSAGWKRARAYTKRNGAWSMTR